ncbi:uncharacterized protein LOC144476765 isoform X1 [Augochlora pura]
MSEHDDTLLDEDLGDEEYDLGNDEEEALLADDYELERQNSYKGEEETDDVLDLGVTDALDDDLDGEDENLELNRSNDNDFYDDGHQLDVQSKYYEQDEINEYKIEQTRQQDERSGNDNINTSANIGKGDLREKLQKNAKMYAATTGQGMEDDECEEAKERRNRFQNERTIVSPKMNTNIPDSLENVVTSEPSKLIYRGRGRGRSARGNRGGRFNTQNSGNFNPRFNNVRNMNFDGQTPAACRPPLLEARPPFLLGVPNNVQNQQIIYQQSNSQVQPFQHYSPNGSLQGPTHFVDSRPQFNPNQFQGQIVPRIIGPRLDYGPRGNLPGSLQGPPYSHNNNHSPSQPPYGQIQPGPFQSSNVLNVQDSQTRLMQNNQGPLLQGNPGASLLGNLNPLVASSVASAPVTLLQGNQTLPLQGFPRQSSQGPPINHSNVQVSNQPHYENRPTFQEAQFENRPVYDSRSGYTDQVPTSQFNTNTLPVPQQPASNVPNVPLPPGHKILINPHFRGAVQSTNDAARLAWDSTQQQTPLLSQIPSSHFSQSLPSYQNQAAYGQQQQQQGPPHYQQNYQQNKSDDPYAYFSDVWQENKPQKSQSGTLSKPYSAESSYTRDSSYDAVSKYKSSQWDPKDSYQEDHRGTRQNYRDRELQSKNRSDYIPKSRPPSSNMYRESYDQNHAQQKSPGNRPTNASVKCRLPQKRISDPVDRPLRDPSPKRTKPNNRNLQEVRTVDTLNTASTEKKDEENDPEMKEYRKKMEEQKRLREKILREKENRRKMAAMEKQSEEAKNDSSSSNVGTRNTKSSSVLMGAVKDTSMSKGHIGIARGRNCPSNTQATETAEKSSCVRIVRTVQTLQPNDLVDFAKDNNSGHAIVQSNDNTKVLGTQSGTRRVVIQKSLSNTHKVATTIQKTVSNLQKSGQMILQNKINNATQVTDQKAGQAQSDTSKKSVTVGQRIVSNPQRIFKQKPTVNLQKTIINVQEVATNTNAQKVVMNTQNNQRVILQKTPTQQKKLQEIKTNTVKVENLAASTSEAQIRRMCQGIGTIEGIQMGERSATIVFKTQSAAMVFHKKYQRKMIDLSLITVRLVPQSSGTKTMAAVVKIS